MSAATLLPITETLEPTGQDELLALMKEAYAGDVPLYPLGGETSLDFGLPARQEGWGIVTRRLDQVVDFPVRDMTITVQAGITMSRLRETLAAENMQFPVDVPQADQATLGGVIATNFNGPRRYGYGGLRDFVIGIRAIDGRGTPFKGGGRVVKNVAGYDFCKLLTGSLGTLGVITELTLKLRPQVEAAVWMNARVPDWDSAERHLAELVQSRTTPTAIQLLHGPAWANDRIAADDIQLAVALEGTAGEVSWMREQLSSEWRSQGLDNFRVWDGDEAQRFSASQVDFPAEDSPLVLKATMVPSAVTSFMQAAAEMDSSCSLLAHAGNGIVLIRFETFPADGLSRTLVGKLEPLADRGHGDVVVLSNPGGTEMTHQSAWGGIDAPFDVMTSVKQQFDPKNLLNPGRFVYL